MIYIELATGNKMSFSDIRNKYGNGTNEGLRKFLREQHDGKILFKYDYSGIDTSIPF